MKKLFLTLIFLSISIATLGKDHYCKEKEVLQQFSCNDNTILNFKGSFSNVYLHKVTTDEIKIEAKITICSEKESIAESICKKSDLIMKQEFNVIYVETDLKKKNNIDINCDVHIYSPDYVEFDIENSYGDVVLYDSFDEMTADVSFGDFVADELKNNNEIKVEYGEFDVQNVESCELYLSFGEGSIKNVNYMECNLQYSDLEIERLSNELIIDGSFSDLSIDEVDTDFKNIDIDLDYSDTKVYLHKDSSFQYELSSSYGDIKTGGFQLNKYETKDLFTTKYIGDYNKSDTQGSINIHCSFGDIKLKMKKD